MSGSSFNKAAKTAISEGETARRTAAKSLAVKFAGNSRFDPRQLVGLGPKGLSVFLDALARDGLQVPDLPSTAPAESPRRKASGTQRNWAAQRVPEPFWSLRSSTIGIASGLFITLLGATALRFLSYL